MHQMGNIKVVYFRIVRQDPFIGSFRLPVHSLINLAVILAFVILKA